MQILLKVKSWQEVETDRAESGWVETLIQIPMGALWTVAPYLDGIEGGAHGGARSILMVYGTSDLHPWTWYLQEPAPMVQDFILSCSKAAIDSTRSSFVFRSPKPGHN